MHAEHGTDVDGKRVTRVWCNRCAPPRSHRRNADGGCLTKECADLVAELTPPF